MKPTSIHPRLFITSLLFFTFSCIGQVFAQAATVKVNVLGVPGHDRLIKHLREVGYSASQYGPAGRAASDFQVISIGNQVPVDVAVDIIARATRRIPSLKYVVLTGDRERAVGDPMDIAIGATNGILKEFRNAKPLSKEDFRRLLKRDLSRDQFHKLIRSTYSGKFHQFHEFIAPTATGKADKAQTEKVHIRSDGVLVVPNPDGSAQLYAPDGRSGTRTKEGDQWFRRDLPKKTVSIQPPGTVDQAWVNALNKWLESISDGMLEDIEVLLKDLDLSMKNYRTYEREESETLYEKITTRYDYLSFLIEMKLNKLQDEN